MKRRIELPLLHDHHSHVSLYSALIGRTSLLGLDRESALRSLLSLPSYRLNLVTGWRTDSLPLAAEDLEALPPVLILNASLHGYAFSPTALPHILELWPEFAIKARDPAWGERNLPRLFSFYAQVAGFDAAKLALFMEGLAGLGLGSVEDMTLTSAAALRIIADSPYAGRVIAWAPPELFRSLGPETRKACAGVKIFLDGSLGARSALLDAPYLGGGEGRLIYSDEELLALLAEIAGWKTGISIHAIGHGAIEQALRCLDRLAADGLAIDRPRFEHVQFISLGQARRLKEKGARLSMQPNFSADSAEYSDRLHERHARENNPFRMLIDDAGFRPGQDLLFGSDGMPHGAKEAFLAGLHPVFPGQRLSEAELLAGYGLARGIAGKGKSFSIE